jgi:hypothetical protein
LGIGVLGIPLLEARIVSVRHAEHFERFLTPE